MALACEQITADVIEANEFLHLLPAFNGRRKGAFVPGRLLYGTLPGPAGEQHCTDIVTVTGLYCTLLSQFCCKL